MIKDIIRELYNFFLYFKKNKIEAARQLIHNTGLRLIQLKMSKKKTKDKSNSIIILYKI